MYRLNLIPSRRNGLHELADFIEWNALIEGAMSEQDVLSILVRESENDDNEGCVDEEERTGNIIESVFGELSRRNSACGGGYPFEFQNIGTRLVFKEDAPARAGSGVYQYLLMSSRTNMQADKVLEGIDGTELLEEISVEVLRNYLGYQRSCGAVFGTAAGGGFRAKVDEFCVQIGEGVGFHPDADPAQKKDDGIDVVAWIPFTDGRMGKLSIFAQCKTGINWRGHISRGAPGIFCEKWLRDNLASKPLPAFIISESANPKEWRELSKDAGLFFDRCRIVDYCPDLVEPVLARVNAWTTAAKRLAADRGVG